MVIEEDGTGAGSIPGAAMVITENTMVLHGEREQ